MLVKNTSQQCHLYMQYGIFDFWPGCRQSETHAVLIIACTLYDRQGYIGISQQQHHHLVVWELEERAAAAAAASPAGPASQPAMCGCRRVHLLSGALLGAASKMSMEECSMAYTDLDAYHNIHNIHQRPFMPAKPC